MAYLEQLQDLGHEVFGTAQRFAQRLDEELPALNKQKPFAYLNTVTGIDAVRQVLLHYQHSIFNLYAALPPHIANLCPSD